MPSKTNDRELRSETKKDDTSRSSTNNAEDIKSQSKSKNSTKDVTACINHWDDPEHLEQAQKDYQEFQKDNRKAAKHSKDESSDGDTKRGRGANASSTAPSKKQKSGAGAHSEASGTQGDKNHLPKKGQKVQWKALPGYVDGEVVEILYEEKKVEGKNVKASKEDPRIVLKSESSGKMCVHKPEAVYFG